MTLRGRANARAIERDRVTHESLQALLLPSPKKLLTEIRAYLLEQRDREGHPGNKVEAELKSETARNGECLLNIGPTVEKGRDDHHYILRSGGRLAFGLTVKDQGSGSRLIAYRFDYRNEEVRQFKFVRFELRSANHHNPLYEPRAHFHPGLEDLRLPSKLIDPFEILDLLFFVIDPLASLAAKLKPCEA